MKIRVNEFIDRFPQFHKLSSAEQVIRLVYFHTEVEHRETVSQAELELLFNLGSVPVARNLNRLLAGLCGKGKRLIQKDGEYKLRREVVKQISAELSGIPKQSVSASGGNSHPFVFEGKTFNDKKVQGLLRELDLCYSAECWNACGILLRIIMERTLDAADPLAKAKEGLRAKLNYCRSTSKCFSRTVKEALGHLEQAKIAGDIVAHHSNIILEKADLEPLIIHFRMLIKEASNI